MEESPEVVCFAPCVSCGKATFKDLVDENLKCEYCREVGRQARAHTRNRVTTDRQ